MFPANEQPLSYRMTMQILGAVILGKFGNLGNFGFGFVAQSGVGFLGSSAKSNWVSVSTSRLSFHVQMFPLAINQQ